MWQDKLKEIIYILENSDVNEIEVTFWGKKFRVLKNSPNITTSSPNKVINTKNSQSSSSDNLENKNLDEENKISILSPMPGVFYSSQSPDKPTYVKEGDTIKSGQVLCIIESMKIMNEIESEHNGVIKKILVNNSDPVEFNQPLYVIEPS
ncbi:MAG: acetyl-CoA carboxylase biotin carboxyl carrier protein [Candidatus Neomarinimicrobiota bacterium]|nr:acetyl-CoA carboxylase biotin carboxyl carrier protein [Candidatus Neomarinimicrobiota bacterium]|tara:strand:- start:51 stop:500 length:450 start_codon:yes stop_codon:yes gene_type:complete